ncbi:DEAD/DEAH box helicase [Nioella sediminis]|uniref:DEAD/DEAH box helicase n=1 Tax=Nioella sediminis TaxID=1912092 RepID=UPI0008FCEBEA|nr:DEAD/DEAH box helicase [Nioella sediminis]TBX26111.1 DEAD/DEAH box helicase [Roseovarius sp. JS7-11]
MIKTLSDALAERGYDTLTSVQEAVTDPELQDADLLVSAQTGSGKTVGFGLAIAQTLLGEAEVMGPAEAPLALVVAPTRELAFQVMRELSWLYAKAGARVTSCVGGMDFRDERRALERGAHIVVGTPGRLRDHIQRGTLDMTGLRAIVLDEADEMLDLGFREDLEFMLGEAPEDRRTLMFSATVPPMIVTLAQHYQRDAVRVSTQDAGRQHADITYQALRVAEVDAENAIINLLRYHEAENAIVFANTRATVARLTARFANRGFSVVSLSGELSQSERTHALQAMRDGRARVCVATDVAARGIDLPNLELVIHADLPSNSETLLHRSGRTGRAGRKGISALIVPPKITKKAERLLKWAKITAEWTVPPSADDILRQDEERLLTDPAWEDEITEDQATFATRLLETHSPETIAAAYLRLYRSRHSAPEELSAPDARPAPKERKPFGPSRWFALSVGANDRAEPRWLLPLLCRAGNLDKDAIGAIRVQQSETFVELTEASAAKFASSYGNGAELDEGITVRAMDSAPDFAAMPRAPKPGGGPRPGPRSSGPRDDKPRRAPREDRPEREAKPRRTPAERDAYLKDAVKPLGKPRRDGDAPKGKPRAKPTDGPKGKSFDKPRKPKGDGAKPWADKPRSDKPRSDKPRGPKPEGGKPRSDKPRSDKPRGDKPAAAPAPRVSAADPSKRFERPGAKPKPARASKAGLNKPGSKPRKGGTTPPRRPKP